MFKIIRFHSWQIPIREEVPFITDLLEWQDFCVECCLSHIFSNSLDSCGSIRLLQSVTEPIHMITTCVNTTKQCLEYFHKR